MNLSTERLARLLRLLHLTFYVLYFFIVSSPPVILIQVGYISILQSYSLARPSCDGWPILKNFDVRFFVFQVVFGKQKH